MRTYTSSFRRIWEENRLAARLLRRGSALRKTAVWTLVACFAGVMTFASMAH